MLFIISQALLEYDNMQRVSRQSICFSDFSFMFEPSALTHNCFLASKMIDE